MAEILPIRRKHFSINQSINDERNVTDKNPLGSDDGKSHKWLKYRLLSTNFIHALTVNLANKDTHVIAKNTM